MKKSSIRTPQEKQLSLSILAKFRDLRPKDGLPIFKFEEVGTAIVAVFLRKRDEIHTRIDSGASAVDANIIECSDEITSGEHTIFLSTHLKKIFDEYQFSHGDRFVLKLCGIDEESGFKRFACELIPKEGKPPDNDDVPF